jgi:hypothetical protein
MTPHRTPTVVGSAIGSLKSVFGLPVDTAGIAAAGGVALVGWAFGSANTALLLVVGLSMLADLLVGAMRAVVDPLEAFSVAKLYGGFLGKLFRVLLIPTASLVDWVILLSPMPLPEGYATTFPVTAMVMYGLVAAELTSALNHFRGGGVAPDLISAVIRQLDRLRVGREPPKRRHYDVPADVAEQERGRRRDNAQEDS